MGDPTSSHAVISIALEAIETHKPFHHDKVQTHRGDFRPIKMTIGRSRTKEARREKKAVYTFEDGDIIDADKIPNTSHSKPGLFMQDLHNFYTHVHKGKIPADAKNLSIRSLEIAEEIHSFF